MPQEPRPKLRPVSSPTDPFVTPGIAPPTPPTINFGALSGLSDTIYKYEQGKAARDAKAERDSRQLAVDLADDNTAVSVNSEEEQMLHMLNIIDRNSPEAQEYLKSKGYRRSDDPRVRDMIFSSMELVAWRQTGFERIAKSPQFVDKISRLIIANKEDEATKLQEDLVAQSISRMGGIKNERSNSIIRAKMKETLASTRESVATRTEKLADELSQESLSNGLVEALSLAEDINMESGGNLGAKIKASVGQFSAYRKEETDSKRRQTQDSNYFNFAASKFMAGAGEPGNKEAYLEFSQAVYDEFPRNLKIRQRVTDIGRALEKQEDIAREKNRDDSRQAQQYFRYELSRMMNGWRMANPTATASDVSKFVFNSEEVEKLMQTVSEKFPQLERSQFATNLDDTVTHTTNYLQTQRQSTTPEAAKSIAQLYVERDPDRASLYLDTNSQFMSNADAIKLSTAIQRWKNAPLHLTGEQERIISDYQGDILTRNWTNIKKTPASSKLRSELWQLFEGHLTAAVAANPEPEKRLGLIEAAKAAVANSDTYARLEKTNERGPVASIKSHETNQKIYGIVGEGIAAYDKAEDAKEDGKHVSKPVKLKTRVQSIVYGKISSIWNELKRSHAGWDTMGQDEQIAAVQEKLMDVTSTVVHDILRGDQKYAETKSAVTTRDGSYTEVSSPSVISSVTPELETSWLSIPTPYAAQRSFIHQYLTTLNSEILSPDPYATLTPKERLAHDTRIAKNRLATNQFARGVYGFVDDGRIPSTKTQFQASLEATNLLLVSTKFTIDNGRPMTDAEMQADPVKANMVASSPSQDRKNVVDEAYAQLRGVFMVRGFTPEQLLSGEALGFNLSDIPGPSGLGTIYETLNPRTVWIYKTVDDVNAAEAEWRSDSSNSQAAKVLKKMGFDPGDAERSKEIFKWFKDTAVRRAKTMNEEDLKLLDYRIMPGTEGAPKWMGEK